MPAVRCLASAPAPRHLLRRRRRYLQFSEALSGGQAAKAAELAEGLARDLAGITATGAKQAATVAANGREQAGYVARRAALEADIAQVRTATCFSAPPTSTSACKTGAGTMPQSMNAVGSLAASRPRRGPCAFSSSPGMPGCGGAAVRLL